MEPNPERGREKIPVVELNQWFEPYRSFPRERPGLPFPLSYTVSGEILVSMEPGPESFARFLHGPSVAFDLSLGGEIVVPFASRLLFSHSSKRGEVLRPFVYAKDYPIDERDRTWKTRRRKALLLKNELVQPSHDASEGLCVLVISTTTNRSNVSGMLAYGISEQGKSGEVAIKPEYRDLLKRLRCQVDIASGKGIPPSYPGARLEGKPSMWDEKVHFGKFYPAEIGPLAISKRKMHLFTRQLGFALSEGLDVLVPRDDEEALQTVSVRFFLQEQQRSLDAPLLNTKGMIFPSGR